MTKLGAFALTLTLLLMAGSATRAADRTVTLRLGAETALALARPFKTILIGDPGIVEVHAQGERSVVLEPLNPGATNLVFVDERSIAIANVRVLVCSGIAVRIGYRDEPDCGAPIL